MTKTTDKSDKTNIAFDALYPVTPSELIFFINSLTSRMNSRGEPKPMQAAFIWGPSGIGKTEIVGQIATNRGCRLVALHLPQYDPTDVKGIPVRMDDGTIKWVPSSYLAQQFKFVDVSETSHTVTFSYATAVSVYLMNDDGVEVYRVNDPTLPDIDEVGVGECDISRKGKEWTVELDTTPPAGLTLIIVDKTIIFLDELSAADSTVQKSALQLVLEGRVGDYEVPHCTAMIAAGNREKDGAHVQAFNHPLANRFAHYTLVPSVDDWIDWALNERLPPEFIGFVKFFGKDALYQYDSGSLSNGNYGFTTPRSLTAYARQFEDLAFFEQLFEKQVASNSKRMRMIHATSMIGPITASAFIGFLEIMHDLPSPDDIMNGLETELGNVERSQSYGLFYALIFKLEECFDRYYDLSLPRDEQADDWKIPRDNILDFITHNGADEIGAWANSMIFQKTEINSPALRGNGYDRFATKFAPRAAHM